MINSTITLETKYYQELCNLIAQQEKVIGIYQGLQKAFEGRIKTMKELDHEKDIIIKKLQKLLKEYEKIDKVFGIVK